MSEGRQDLRFKYLSGERWRAAAAFGYAQGKRIFFAPYNPSYFYYCMCGSSLLVALRELTDHGALVLLPVGSDEFMKHIADEIVYLRGEYDVEGMRERYISRFGIDAVH